MRRDDLIRLRHMLDVGRNAMTFAAGKNRTDLGSGDTLANSRIVTPSGMVSPDFADGCL